MKMLVTFASKHQGTEGIAAELSQALASHGLDVTTLSVEEVSSLERYDAVILGSAVYMDHWLKAASAFVTKYQASLKKLPVWLFSSGPVGEQIKPSEDPIDIEMITEMTGAIGHRNFAGRLDRSRLRFIERVAATAVGAPEGDFRDWNETRAWAGEIADALYATRATMTK